MATHKKKKRVTTKKFEKRVLRPLSRKEKATLKKSRRPRKRVKPKTGKRFVLKKYQAEKIGSAFDQEKKVFTTSWKKTIWDGREPVADLLEERTLKLKNQIGNLRPTIWGIYWIYQCKLIESNGQYTDDQGSTNRFMRDFKTNLSEVKRRFLITSDTTGSKSSEWFAPLQVKIYAVYYKKPKANKKR